MPPNRKRVSVGSSKTKTLEQVDKDERLARSRQKAREWAERQKLQKSGVKTDTHDNINAIETNTAPTLVTTPSKTVFKATLRKSKSAKTSARKSNASARNRNNKTPETIVKNKFESEDDEDDSVIFYEEESEKSTTKKRRKKRKERDISSDEDDSSMELNIQSRNNKTPETKVKYKFESEGDEDDELLSEEEEPKLLLSKREIVARAKRKSQVWAESKMTSAQKAKRGRKKRKERDISSDEDDVTVISERKDHQPDLNEDLDILESTSNNWKKKKIKYASEKDNENVETSLKKWATVYNNEEQKFSDETDLTTLRSSGHEKLVDKLFVTDIGNTTLGELRESEYNDFVACFSGGNAAIKTKLISWINANNLLCEFKKMD